MAPSAERVTVLLFASALGAAALAQPGTTFAYTGEDAVLSALNTHHAHFGGFSNTVLVVEDENFVWPYLPALFYEYGYLLRPRNHTVNVLLSAAPELYLFPWFMARVNGMAEAGFLADADNKPDQGFGFRLGGGFTALGSTFGITETSPVLRAGITLGNLRFTYMHMVRREALFNHHVGVALKFDW